MLAASSGKSSEAAVTVAFPFFFILKIRENERVLDWLTFSVIIYPTISFVFWPLNSFKIQMKLDFRHEGSWFDAWPLPSCGFHRQTTNFTPHFVSPPRCINGYRRHTAGGYPWDRLAPHPGGEGLQHSRLLHATETGNKLLPPAVRVRLYPTLSDYSIILKNTVFCFLSSNLL